MNEPKSTYAKIWYWCSISQWKTHVHPRNAITIIFDRWKKMSNRIWTPEHVNIISFLPICNKRLIQFCRRTDWDDLISSRTPYYKVGCLINQIFQLHCTHILIYMMRCLLKLLSCLKVTVYSFLSACRVISNVQFMHHTMNDRKYNTEI